ncbi:MAG: EboA domain-containing protein, partial [Myxococcales bacterium]|nr:EboA domain-containing protein [Myxococcales bacterium]
MSATPAESRAALDALLRARLGDGPGVDFLAAHADDDVETLRAAFADLRRIVGARPLVASFQERETVSVPTAWGDLVLGRWTTDTAARVLLLAQAVQRTSAPYAALYAAYDLGDTETRVAALHALSFVDDPEEDPALEIIADAGRTYLEQLMEAAWCGNPFTAAHLDDQQYRKAVLKALFCGLDVSRFIGLEDRADAELAKSLCEFADEREAAGRPVPPAVWVVSALHPRPGLVARLIGRMEHPLPDERLV